MGLLVSCQVRRLGEPLLAVGVRAYIGLLAGVRAQMRPQIEVQREALVASLAFVRLLACVDELVPFELRIVEELLVAASDRTGKHPFPMGHLVFAVRSLVWEHLLAVFNHADVLLGLGWLLHLYLRVRGILQHLSDLIRGWA